MADHIDDISDEDLDELAEIFDDVDLLPETDETDEKEWSPSNSQAFGPIPPEAFTNFHPSKIKNEYVNKRPRRNCNTPINIESQQKEQVDSVVTHNNNNTVRRDDGSNLRPSVRLRDTSGLQIQSSINVLERSGTSSSGESLPIRKEMVIPVRARSECERPPNLNPGFPKPSLPLPVAEKDSDSIQEKKRQKTSKVPKGQESSSRQAMTRLPDVEPKRCSHCQTTDTPLWREGPQGKGTLCNACGIRHRTNDLFPEYRPATSRTFSPDLHSNSRKGVMEKRKKDQP